MEWYHILIIILAIILIVGIIIRVTNNLVKTIITVVIVVFVSGMLWSTLSDENKTNVDNMLKDAGVFITEGLEKIFQFGEENSDKINKIKEIDYE